MKKNQHESQGFLIKTLHFFENVFKKMWKGLRNNWAWKCISVVLAIVLWGGVIAQDRTLTRPKTFEKVPVDISSLQDDTLKYRGYIATNDLASNPPTATITVNIPLAEYNSVKAEDFSIRVAPSTFSVIKEAGKYSLPITSSTTTSKYGTISNIEPNVVDVVVDDYVSQANIAVAIEKTGVQKDNVYVTEPEKDLNYVKIYGPKTIVNEISRVAVKMDYSVFDVEYGDSKPNNIWPFTLQTLKDGTYQDLTEKQANLIKVTDGNNEVKLRFISTKQNIYPKKVLSVDPNTSVTIGNPAKGYELGEVKITTKEVTVYGDKSALEQFDSILVNKEDLIDITDEKSETLLSADKQPQKNVQVKIMNDSSGKVNLSPETLIVAYKIVPTLKERTFENRKIEIIGLDEKVYVPTITNNIDKIAVTLVGPANWIDDLKENHIKVYLDLTGKEAGSFSDVPISVEIDPPPEEMVDFEYILEESFVNVTIVEK